MTIVDADKGKFGSVSIHTPTKGVTKDCKNQFLAIPVSIHTPTKGVTGEGDDGAAYRKCFNPHTHEGCDFLVLFLHVVRKGFNPHTHEGCDPGAAYRLPCRNRFNPHTHEGCDW